MVLDVVSALLYAMGSYCKWTTESSVPCMRHKYVVGRKLIPSRLPRLLDISGSIDTVPCVVLRPKGRQRRCLTQIRTKQHRSIVGHTSQVLECA